MMFSEFHNYDNAPIVSNFYYVSSCLWSLDPLKIRIINLKLKINAEIAESIDTLLGAGWVMLNVTASESLCRRRKCMNSTQVGTKMLLQ